MDPPIGLFALTFLLVNVVSNCYEIPQSRDVTSRVSEKHLDDVNSNNLESRFGKLSKVYKDLLANKGWNDNKKSKIVKVTYRRRTKKRNGNHPNILYNYVHSHSVVGGNHRNVPLVHSNGINDLVTSVNSQSSWPKSSSYYGGSTSQTVENGFGVPSYYGGSAPESFDNSFSVLNHYDGSTPGTVENGFYGGSKSYDVNNYNSNSRLPSNLDDLQRDDNTGSTSDIFQVAGTWNRRPSNAFRVKWVDNTLDSKTVNPKKYFRSAKNVAVKDVTAEDVTSEDVTSEDVTSEDVTNEDVTSEVMAHDAVTGEGVIVKDVAVDGKTAEDVTSELDQYLLKGADYNNVNVVSKNNKPYWRTFRDKTVEDVTGEDLKVDGETAEDVTSEINENVIRRGVHKNVKLLRNNNKSFWRNFKGETAEDVTSEDVTAEDVTGEGVTAEDVTTDGVTAEDVTSELSKKIYWKTLKTETVEDVTAEDVTAEDVTSEDITPLHIVRDRITHEHPFSKDYIDVSKSDTGKKYILKNVPSTNVFSGYYPSHTHIRFNGNNYGKVHHLPYISSYEQIFQKILTQICEKSKKLLKRKPTLLVIKKLKRISKQLNVLYNLLRERNHIDVDYDLPDDDNQSTDIESPDYINWINPKDSNANGKNYRFTIKQLIRDLKRLKPVNVDLDLQLLYKKLIKYLQYYFLNNNGNAGHARPNLDSVLIPILTALRNQLENPQKSQTPKITLKIKLLLSFLHGKYGGDSWNVDNIDDFENGDDSFDGNYETYSPDYGRIRDLIDGLNDNRLDHSVNLRIDVIQVPDAGQIKENVNSTPKIAETPVILKCCNFNIYSQYIHHHN
ncbi:unnamed protein product [Diatraea saccharalis]|uniref:Uncharacterized protein n=1 Tax=Diatraea saccharalis TaxID=40085 RepID=A0A9N9R4T8_9NEOP|nr:unnamed protein product [Diatraea saccharalis]